MITFCQRELPTARTAGGVFLNSRLTEHLIVDRRIEIIPVLSVDQELDYRDYDSYGCDAEEGSETQLPTNVFHSL